MGTARYTPGPWAVEDPFGPDQYSIVQDGLEAYEWRFIAHVPVGIPAEGLCPRQEAQANARLMAAAPDFYRAAMLRREYEAMPADRGGVNGPKGRARAAWLAAEEAAIAKADGRS